MASSVTPVDPVAAATYFVQSLGCLAFPVWGSRAGRCLCGDPHDGTGKHGPDNVGKHPATIHGFKDATADVDAIRKFLSNPGTPNYGLNAPEGVLVVDVDGPGTAEWEALQHKHGPLPVTLTTTTANGRHYFFRWPADAGPMPTGKLFGFVVRRHDDGYVIGPGSVHPSGVQYDTLRQDSGMPYPIADLPRSWADAAAKPEPYIVVAGKLPDVGERHDWLRNTARLFAGTVRDPDALKAAVMVENLKLPQPKSEAEVDRAIGAVLARFGPDPVETDPDTGEVRRVFGDEPGLLSTSTSEDFPEPPAAAAYEGLLGEVTDYLAEGTDASSVGLLGSLLAFCGALMPAKAYMARTQTTSPFIALVGESSVGRKGTAMNRAGDALASAVGIDVVNDVTLDGINSGEGLISEMCFKQRSSKPTAGVLFEEEYATMMAAQGREGSTLDGRMRAAFDGGPLSNRKAAESKTVNPPYWLPALIAITPSELRSKLPSGALQSGSGNRWLYLPVVRHSRGFRNIGPALPEDLRDRLVKAHSIANRMPMQLGVDDDVSDTLTQYSEHLRTTTLGLAADMTRRFAVIAFRIALVHAAVECAARVTLDHLRRALALTEYARAGMGWVFGQSLGNPLATLLLRHLQDAGSLSATHITRHIIRDPLKRQDAIDELIRLGFARVGAVVGTGGRRRSELQVVAPEGSRVPIFQGSSVPPSEAESRGNQENKASGARSGLEQSVENSGSLGKQEPIWSHPCRDYEAHRGEEHRNTPTGWRCFICYPEEPA